MFLQFMQRCTSLEAGNVELAKITVNWLTSEENVRTNQKFIFPECQEVERSAAYELLLSKFIVHDILHKRLKLGACKMQLLQMFNQADFIWLLLEDFIPWSLWLPYIIPLYFFLWGNIKDRVYQTPVFYIFVLKERVQLKILTVTFQMLNTWREIQYRLGFHYSFVA